MSLIRSYYRPPMPVINRSMTETLPMRSRVDTNHLNANRIPYYLMITKLVIGLGIASTTCGIIILSFGVVYSLLDFESNPSSLYFKASVGLWVVFNGFITILSGSRRHSWCQLYVFMMCSLVTIGLTGALSVVIANSLFNLYSLENFFVINKNTDHKNIDLLFNSPTLLINRVMLTFCVLAFFLSIITFYISGQRLCQYYIDRRIKKSFHPKYTFDPEINTRMDRNLQRIVHQPNLQLEYSTDYKTIPHKHENHKNHKNMVSHYNLTAVKSTRLSAYYR